MSKIVNTLNNIKGRNCKNNTQKVALRLLKAEGKWLSRRELEASVKSATSIVRDLRTDRYGRFTVDCVHASDLNKQGDSFYYRINPSKVTKQSLKTVFGSLI